MQHNSFARLGAVILPLLARAVGQAARENEICTSCACSQQANRSWPARLADSSLTSGQKGLDSKRAILCNCVPPPFLDAVVKGKQLAKNHNT